MIRRSPPRSGAMPEGFLLALIYSIIQDEPAWRIGQVWACLKFTCGLRINRKRVERLMRREGWTLKRHRRGGRPRVEVPRSAAERPHQRWATDIALVHCGTDGWCAFVPVIDCCTREIRGWDLDRSWRARTAERALEAALLGSFGYTRGAPPGLVLRHDNGLVFGSRAYTAAARDYGLRQEYITPYTPQENGLCERFIRTIKHECVWQHTFTDLQHARRVIAAWIHRYNTVRPHSALGYSTPRQVAERHKSVTAAA